MSQFSISSLKDKLQPVVMKALQGVIDGAAEDLQLFVAQITENIAEAGTVSDSSRQAALISELEGQIKTVAEVNRLRINNAAWDAGMKTLKIVIDTLTAAAAVAI